MIGDKKDEGRRALDASDISISLKLLKNTKVSISPQPLDQIGQVRCHCKAGIKENVILEKQKNQHKNT